MRFKDRSTHPPSEKPDGKGWLASQITLSVWANEHRGLLSPFKPDASNGDGRTSNSASQAARASE